jgi:hypothetical protein
LVVREMGYPYQFRKLLGKRVIVEHRRRDIVIVGELTGEDRWFLYIEKAKIVRDGQARDAGTVVLHKSYVGFLRVAEEG